MNLDFIGWQMAMYRSTVKAVKDKAETNFNFDFLFTLKFSLYIMLRQKAFFRVWQLNTPLANHENSR